MLEFDILIIGGGLTGAALLLALEGHGINALMVEAQDFHKDSTTNLDNRALALSPASVRILQMLGIWQNLASHATAIHTIHVSEQGQFAQTRIDGSDTEPLGFVLAMAAINQVMQTQLPLKKILRPGRLIALDSTSGLATILSQEQEIKIQAKLIVAADGANSSVRTLAKLPVKRKSYCQQAITANISLKRAHANQAYERFTGSGSMAMLPMRGNNASLVWVLDLQSAQELMAMQEPDFLLHLQKNFGYRLGQLTSVSPRTSFPLEKLVMPSPIAWPLIFIGNAAHTLHPIAGQGFNLGLRDAASLAQCIIQYGPHKNLIEHYEAMRSYDQQAIINLTDGLVEVFANKFPGLSLLRALGLLSTNILPLAKQCITRHASGFAGVVPDLACGIPLGKHNAV